MKFKDINKRYTDIVADYLSKGYNINTATMSGSQGEIANIDLTNGNEIIRVLITSFSDWKADTEGVEIVVGKATDSVEINGSDRLGNIIWNNRLEVLSQERFYQIGRYRHDYYSTEADAKKAAELRYQRYCNRKIKTTQYVPSPKAMEIAKKIAHSKFGIKRIAWTVSVSRHLFRCQCHISFAASASSRITVTSRQQESVFQLFPCAAE